jgi:hypothetical protein
MSEKQGSDLLAIKKRLGLPDVRFDTSKMQECQLSDLEVPGSIALPPMPCDGGTSCPGEKDLEKLVKSVTDAVMQEIAAR